MCKKNILCIPINRFHKQAVQLVGYVHQFYQQNLSLLESSYAPLNPNLPPRPPLPPRAKKPLPKPLPLSPPRPRKFAPGWDLPRMNVPLVLGPSRPLRALSDVKR